MSRAAAVSEEARALCREAVVVDLHCDLLLTTRLLGWRWDRRHRPNPLPGAPVAGHCDLPRLREGGVDALALGVVTAPVGPPGRGLEIALRLLRERAEAGDVEVATTAGAVLAARAAGRLAGFAVLEGAHGLPRDWREVLPGLLERGLAGVGLVHFTANRFARPMTGWGAGGGEALTDEGRALLEALDAHRMLVDLAHLRADGVVEACRRARRPVLCSHTACAAVHPSRRALPDEALRAVADTGGVVGVIFVAPFVGGGLDAVVAQLEHLRRTVGAAHVGFGSDWEGFAVYARGLESADRLPALADALLRRGWRPEEVRGILGGNALRLLRDVRGG